MDLVSMSASFILICLTVASTGDAAAVRRDVPIIGIPFNNNAVKPSNVTNATTTTEKPQEKDKSTKDVKKDIHESYPNPPVPTPAGFSLHKLFHHDKKDNNTVKAQHGTVKATPTKWGFNDEYLASQNKYAIKRNVLYDGVGGDPMSFSNFQVLGNQDVAFGKK